MKKGTESALSGQTEKHIVSLDALCNLAPFSSQSEKSMANGGPKHPPPKKKKKKKERERERERERGKEIKQVLCSIDRMANTY